MGGLLAGLFVWGLSLGASGAAQQEVDPKDCEKVGGFNNILPGAWNGMIACGLAQDLMPPTTGEIELVSACLDKHEIEYDLTRLVGFRYFFAEDFITYPTQWLNPTQFRVVIGWTDHGERRIMIRRHMNIPNYNPREILMHELVHAVTQKAHGGPGDPFDAIEECLPDSLPD